MKILCQISRNDLKEQNFTNCMIEKGGSVNSEPSKTIIEKLAAVLHQLHIDNENL